MNLMKKLTALLLALCAAASMAVSASAAGPLQYTFDGTGDPEYGKPTSIEVVQTRNNGERKNTDMPRPPVLSP